MEKNSSKQKKDNLKRKSMYIESRQPLLINEKTLLFIGKKKQQLQNQENEINSVRDCSDSESEYYYETGKTLAKKSKTPNNGKRQNLQKNGKQSNKKNKSHENAFQPNEQNEEDVQFIYIEDEAENEQLNSYDTETQMSENYADDQQPSSIQNQSNNLNQEELAQKYKCLLKSIEYQNMKQERDFENAVTFPDNSFELEIIGFKIIQNEKAPYVSYQPCPAKITDLGEGLTQKYEQLVKSEEFKNKSEAKTKIVISLTQEEYSLNMRALQNQIPSECSRSKKRNEKRKKKIKRDQEELKRLQSEKAMQTKKKL